MLKNKSLLIAAIIFGGIGIILAVLTGILFLNDNTGAFKFISDLLGINSEPLTAAKIWQLTFVIEAAAFILGYRALIEEADK